MLLDTLLLLAALSLGPLGVDARALGHAANASRSLEDRGITTSTYRPSGDVRRSSAIKTSENVLSLSKKSVRYNKRSAAYLLGRVTDAAVTATYANGSSSVLTSLELGQEYATTITIGTKTFEVAVDTGSSDTVSVAMNIASFLGLSFRCVLLRCLCSNCSHFNLVNSCSHLYLERIYQTRNELMTVLASQWVVESGFTCIDLETGRETSAAECGFGSYYTKDLTFKQTSGEEFEIEYGDGEYLTGIIGTETVKLAGVTVTGQTIGVVTSAAWEGDGTTSGLTGLAYTAM